MNLKLVGLLVAITFATVVAEKTRYDNYKLVDVFIKTKKQAQLIEQLENEPDFDLWGRFKAPLESAKIVLSPEAFAKYTKLFELYHIQYEVLRENMQEVMDQEESQMAKTRNTKVVGRYARLSEIHNYIDTLSDENPSLVSSYIAGRTHENRALKVAVIKSPTASRKIWIDCGIHAREWVSPSTCVYILDKLISDYKAGVAATKAIVDYYEFHILPVMNADGYEFSHTTTRLWRKNRYPTNAGCPGVDLNRNFPYQWMTGGSSNQPCSDTYAGSSAGSELESKAVMNAISAYKGQWDSYLTIHSYGKWWFTPYGYSAAVVPPDFTNLRAKAQIGVNALAATYGETGWIQGSSSQILYIASGGSEDWTYSQGINYSYCLELRPGQSGTDAIYGFQLPEDRAPRAGEETYRGVLAFLNSIKP